MKSEESTVDDSVLSGKTCIVTGATSGIGRETAIGLAKLGSSLIIVGRSKDKCEETKNHIMKLTANKDIDYEVSELSLMDSVRELAERLTSQHNHIYALINNAGGVFSKYSLTRDGFENTTALNYLSPFLLTKLLLPSLKSTASSRIINIGSGAHSNGRAEFDFRYPWRYAAMKAYSTSKLMLTMFSYALARRLPGEKMSCVLVQPGFVATNLGRNSGSKLLSASFGIMKPFQIEASEAAETPIFLASSANREELNGKCYSRMKACKTSPISYNEELQEELWDSTTKVLGLTSDIDA